MRVHRIDWSLRTNNFGVGLPPRSKNEHRYHVLKPLLAHALKYRPDSRQMRETGEYVKVCRAGHTS
jgi:hypothetical protein